MNPRLPSFIPTASTTTMLSSVEKSQLSPWWCLAGFDLSVGTGNRHQVENKISKKRKKIDRNRIIAMEKSILIFYPCLITDETWRGSRVIMQQTNDNVEACRVASCHLPSTHRRNSFEKLIFRTIWLATKLSYIFPPLLLSHNTFE